MSIIGIDDLQLDAVVDAASMPRELAHFSDIDPDKIHWEIIKHKKLDTDVDSSVIDCWIEDALDATPNIKLTIHDPGWELLDSGAMTKAVEMKVGDRWYRLLGIEVQDDDITCTFVIRNAIYLMHHTKRRKANRKNTTRAEFIQILVKSVKKVKIPFFCKQLHKVQKVEPLRLNRDNTRQRGLPAAKDSHITVKGKAADSEQRKNIEDVIAEGEQMNGPRLAFVGAIMCIIQESTARRSATAGQFVGLFQQSSRYGWPATRNARKDAHGFYEKFIPLVRAHPHTDLGTLIAQVQRPLHPEEYALGCDRWRDEAENAVDQFVGGGGLKSTEFKKRYDYETLELDDGTNENYLAAIYRFAEEVNWRAFWRGNELHYESEEDLFKSRSRMRIVRDDVEGISFTLNEQGRKVNSMTIKVRMERWFVPIGSVATFGPKAGANMIAGAKVRDNPANGRWLVTNIRKNGYNDLGEVTLAKPIEEKLEPAPEIGVRQIDDGSGPGADGLGGLVGGSYVIDTSEGARSVVESLALIAGAPSPVVSGGSGIHVISDLREGDTVASGQPSDHSDNDSTRAARDIGYNGVNALTGPPPKHLDAGMKRIASALGRSYTPGQTVIWTIYNWKSSGIRIQVIWRTPLYGGHMGHIHVGAHNEVPIQFR